MGYAKIGVVAMLSALALAACGSSETAGEKQPAEPRATEVTLFAPTTDDGSPSVKPTKSLAGSCWTSSFTRSDGYRCESKSHIYDPCFGIETGRPATRVLCLSAPYDQNPVEIKVSTLPELDQSEVVGPEDGNPWALELANGKRCEQTGGATSAVNGQRLNYVCDKELALYGDPDRSSKTWTIYAREGDEAQLKHVPIAHAYF